MKTDEKLLGDYIDTLLNRELAYSGETLEITPKTIIEKEVKSIPILNISLALLKFSLFIFNNMFVGGKLKFTFKNTFALFLAAKDLVIDIIQAIKEENARSKETDKEV